MSLPLKYSEIGNQNRIITKQMILDNFLEYQKLISFFRSYPDRLIDELCLAMGEECTFQLYDFQRILLRALARHKEVFFTFSRGTSKSFIDYLWDILQCILYPNTKLGVVASTKSQSGAILESKISEILSLLPILRFEIKKIEKIKDSFTVYFKNGSYLQNLAAKPSSRGLRFTGVTLEEVIEADPDAIQEIVLPTLAIQRRAANGFFNPEETITQQRVCVTTAGYKDSFSYNMLIRTLLRQLSEPGKAIVLGGSYRIPIIDGLQNMDFIRQQKLSGTFNPTSFAREYLSRWSSGSEKAYFKAEIFDKYRGLKEPIFERENSLGSGVQYIFGIDIGRVSDQSEVVVWKYIFQKGTTSTKHLVNIVTFDRMHFNEQAIEIKKLYEKYKPERVVVDANGLGIGLVDELIKPQVDVSTNQYLRPWGVMNDDKGYYTQFKSADMIPNLLYLIKANAPLNTEIYSNMQVQLTTGKLRFLIDERQAKMNLDASRAKKFKDMSEDEKLDWIVPFTLTSLFRDQLINLEEKNEGINIILERSNKNIKKDKVSAAAYGLYYIKVCVDDPAMMRKTSALMDVLNMNNKTGTQKQNQLKATFKTNRNYMNRKK